MCKELVEIRAQPTMRFSRRVPIPTASIVFLSTLQLSVNSIFKTVRLFRCAREQHADSGLFGFLESPFPFQVKFDKFRDAINEWFVNDTRERNIEAPGVLALVPSKENTVNPLLASEIALDEQLREIRAN